jgi:hypothetical protein
MSEHIVQRQRCAPLGLGPSPLNPTEHRLGAVPPTQLHVDASSGKFALGRVRRRHLGAALARQRSRRRPTRLGRDRLPPARPEVAALRRRRRGLPPWRRSTDGRWFGRVNFAVCDTYGAVQVRHEGVLAPSQRPLSAGDRATPLMRVRGGSAPRSISYSWPSWECCWLPTPTLSCMAWKSSALAV